MGVADTQVRKLMEEQIKHGGIGRAAMMAGMDRKTARKYLRSGKLPSEMKGSERDYRTREDPFAGDWPMLEGMLGDAPALESKALFEWLMDRNPGRYEPGQVRTLQRKIKNWRATCDYVVMDYGGNGCGTNNMMEVCSKLLGNTAQGLCDMIG